MEVKLTILCLSSTNSVTVNIHAIVEEGALLKLSLMEVRELKILESKKETKRAFTIEREQNLIKAN